MLQPRHSDVEGDAVDLRGHGEEDASSTLPCQYHRKGNPWLMLQSFFGTLGDWTTPAENPNLDLTKAHVNNSSQHLGE